MCTVSLCALALRLSGRLNNIRYYFMSCIPASHGESWLVHYCKNIAILGSSYLSVLLWQTPNKGELKEEGFVPAVVERGHHPLRWRRSGWRECEAAGYSVSTVRRQREMNVSTQLIFCLLFNPEPQPLGMLPPTSMVCLPASLEPLWK